MQALPSFSTTTSRPSYLFFLSNLFLVSPSQKEFLHDRFFTKSRLFTFSFFFVPSIYSILLLHFRSTLHCCCSNSRMYGPHSSGRSLHPSFSYRVTFFFSLVLGRRCFWPVWSLVEVGMTGLSLTRELWLDWILIGLQVLLE